MIAERGFPLIRKFNSLINRMKDTGLIEKIYDDFLFNKTILDFIHDKKGIADVSQTRLTVQHLQGAFAVLIVGLLISFVVFVVEVVSKSQSFLLHFGNIASSINKAKDQLMIKTRLKKKPLKIRKKFK